jgi:hypothetical protein
MEHKKDEPLVTESIRKSIRKYTSNYGMEHQNQAWILSPYDTWEKNPHYIRIIATHPSSYTGDVNYPEFTNEIPF